MKIETDPELHINEPSLLFGDLEPGDVFRFADISYQGAIDTGYIFMKLSMTSTVTAVTLGSGKAVTLKDSDEVIVHVSKLVVTPNV